MYKVLKARGEPLFCQLDLLFFHVLVAVAVLVCLRSLKKRRRRRFGQRWLKNDLVFTYESRDTLSSSSWFLTLKIISKLNIDHCVKL